MKIKSEKNDNNEKLKILINESKMINQNKQEITNQNLCE